MAAGKSIALAHRRLSVIDLSAEARQPLSYSGGRYWIAFNGEIYNYLELRETLMSQGWNFRTSSDTEVILAAYASWGCEAFKKLEGMFALALLDTKANTLVLARDPFGIKPLYYVLGSQYLAFASEIRPLLDFIGCAPTSEPRLLRDFLLHGFTDHTDNTLLGGVQSVPPASWTRLSILPPCKPETTRYWVLKRHDRVDHSFEEATSTVRDLFLESVAKHLRSDVPVGVCLSGGLDSTAILMAIRKIAGSDADLNAYSFIAPPSAICEEQWVDLAIESSGARSVKVFGDPACLLADVDAMIASQGEPVAGLSVYAGRCVFRAIARDGVKVVLDGQGADELFGGYSFYLGIALVEAVQQGDWQRAAQLARGAIRTGKTKRLLGFSAEQLLSLSIQRPLRALAGQSLTPKWLNASWFTRQGVTLEPARCVNGEGVMGALRKDVTEGILCSLLRYEDRNSMAFSVESRVPFLSVRLAEYVLSLPAKYLISDSLVSKSVLRAAVATLVPKPIAERRDKIGFAAPDIEWLLALTPWVERVLNGDYARNCSALRLDGLVSAWADVTQRRRWDPGLWRCLNLLRWAELYGVTI